MHVTYLGNLLGTILPSPLIRFPNRIKLKK
jgi:hypothetical protein